MVRIESINDKVVINILGLHKLWALKNRIELAKENIKSVRAVDRPLRPPLWRLPGTYIPWLITAGTYRGRKRKEFWDTTFGGRRIAIDLKNAAYTRVVVDVDDPSKAINEIQNDA